MCWPGLAFLLGMGTHVAAASQPKVTCSHFFPEGTSLDSCCSPLQIGSHIISIIITQLPHGLCAFHSPLYSSKEIFPHIIDLSPYRGSHWLQGTRSTSSVWHSRTFLLGLCGSLPTHLLTHWIAATFGFRSSPNNPYSLVMWTFAHKVLSTWNVFTFPIQLANSCATLETQLMNRGWYIFFFL